MKSRSGTRATTSRAYTERVNLAIDFVLSHLSGQLQLGDMARAAFLSPFHFHRIFQALVGETPADFVKRVRLEKAIFLMSHSPKDSLTTIGHRCGFSSSSDFSRAFKQRFGVAPRSFDFQAWQRSHRSELEAFVAETPAGLRINHLPSGANPDGFRVQIRELPARTVAYIRVANPYKGDAVAKAIGRLTAWAEQRSIADSPWLGYQWENPEITSLKDCHYYVALQAERFTPGGEIGRFKFPPMTVAQVKICGGIDLELRAFQ